MPTAPSFFIAEVTKPLGTFLSALPCRIGDGSGAGEQRAGWARDVAHELTANFLALATATLDTVRKNEEALRRLATKKSGATTPSAVGNASGDAHKISVQLFLDVHAYGSQLQELGVELASIPSFVQLEEAVRRF